uniref:Phospholipase A2 n=1 Tax=Varanus komodoensis TaxID=61221 RepID=A0A8D2LRL0_VARKO
GVVHSCKIFLHLLTSTHSLHKRGLLELSGAIKCGTSRFPLMYLTYGCYCGPGGRGWPRDETDWCCHRHDCCYGFLLNYSTVMLYSTLIFRPVFSFSDTMLDRCQQIICQCDREAAKCWRSAHFNQYYIFWPNFLCGHIYPVCAYKSKKGC